MPIGIGAMIGAAAAGAGIEGGINLTNDLIGSVVGDYFGKKSAKRNLRAEFNYSKKLLDYQLEKQYDYNQRYLVNNPSTTVSGLRKAGLNPILAAGGGFSASTPASGSVSSPRSSGQVNNISKGSVRFDPLTLKNMELLDAQIVGQKIKNNNDLQNRGLTGQYGALSRLISESGISKDDPVSQHRPKDFTHVLDSVGEMLGRRLGNDGNSTPKSYVTTSPRTIEHAAIKRANEDTPPSMREHQNYIEHDGFNLRDWHRSSRKFDGQYKYRRREPWEHIYRW